MDPTVINGLSSIFNFSSLSGLAAVAGTGLGMLGIGVVTAKYASPLKMIKPDSSTAYIVTGYKGLKKDQFVVRSAPQAVWKFGMSEPEAVDLKSFTVKITRKGIHKENEGIIDRVRDGVSGTKDESLTLKDKIKAEVDVDFYVQVDTEDTKADGKVVVTGDQKIILAKRTLGNINEKTIRDYLEAKADSALRAAAAQMTIDEIQSDREEFLNKVKANLSLSEHGLKVTDAALRDFKQAPKESFNPNDYFDAQGLKLVTLKANESLQAVNESNQLTQTQIALKTQEQTIERLKIEQTQKAADLAQKQEVARLEAEQARKVKEIQAEQEKSGNIAAIVAAQQTQERDIEKAQKIAVATAAKERAAEEARIAKEQAVELANRQKEIALQAKAAEVAEAQQAANLKRAEAVAAEQSVTTAEEVAKAERAKQVAVIEAKREAEKEAEARKLSAAADVVVATAKAEATRVEAQGKGDAAIVAATADAQAAAKRAEGAYAETFQPLKAKADGDLAQAAAEDALNKARNTLSAEARAFQVDLKRVEVTPEIVQSFVAGMASIDNFNVTSISGAPGSSPAPGGFVGLETPGSSGNVFEQFYAAARQNMIQVPLIEKVITDMGGDPKVVRNMPGMNAAAPNPSVCTTTDAESTRVAPPAPAAAPAAPRR